MVTGWRLIASWRCASSSTTIWLRVVASSALRGRKGDVHAALRDRQRGHEDHQQHQQHVDERCHVHLRASAGDGRGDAGSGRLRHGLPPAALDTAGRRLTQTLADHDAAADSRRLTQTRGCGQELPRWVNQSRCCPDDRETGTTEIAGESRFAPRGTRGAAFCTPWITETLTRLPSSARRSKYDGSSAADSSRPSIAPSLRIEFELRRIPFDVEPELSVHFKDRCVGTFHPDFICYGRVIVEVKAHTGARRRPRRTDAQLPASVSAHHARCCSTSAAGPWSSAASRLPNLRQTARAPKATCSSLRESASVCGANLSV